MPSQPVARTAAALALVGAVLLAPAPARGEPAGPTVVTLALDPAPGVERALRSAWEDAVAAPERAGRLPDAPLPGAVLRPGPSPWLSFPVARAVDAWAWARALATAAGLVVQADPPEQAAVGPDAPATLEVRLAPAALAEARRQALAGTQALVLRRLSAAEGIDAVVAEPDAGGERVTLRVEAPSLGSAARQAAIERALPVQAGVRLRIVALGPADRARAALEEALAAWSASRAEAPVRLQVTTGPAPTAELIGADARLAKAVADQPRRRPDERLVVLGTAPGAGRQGFVLLHGPALLRLWDDVLGAEVDLTSDFEPVVRLGLGKVSTRRVAELVREAGGLPLALVREDEVLALYRSPVGLSDGFGDGFLDVPAAGRAGAGADERARQLAAALRDLPAGARVTVERITTEAAAPVTGDGAPQSGR